jgi:phosphohistidine phosphatase
MMELFLVRHAVAVERTADLPDAARPLTPRGTRMFAKVVVRFDRLIHSPWTRAVQTADLLFELLDGESAIEPGLARAPNASLVSRLAGGRVAAVGHEPWLSELLSLLVTGARNHAERFAFRKGGVAWLDGQPRQSGMQLRAFLPPRVLRLI